jgi:arsenate reductase (glutaredoxin)
MTITIYGIRNCDTMKKARAWLDQHDVAYTFHDYRKDGVDGEQLQRWCDTVGWERLLNRAGTTFRKLPDDEKTDLDSTRAIALMLSHPAMIKRPVLVAGDRLIVGFQPQRYADLAG